MKVAHQKDPVFYARVLPKYVKNCAMPNPNELAEKFDDVASFVEGMKCVVSVSEEKLVGTVYESAWLPKKMYFNSAIREIGNCKNDK